jgi:hypothetical protein
MSEKERVGRVIVELAVVVRL